MIFLYVPTPLSFSLGAQDDRGILHIESFTFPGMLMLHHLVIDTDVLNDFSAHIFSTKHSQNIGLLNPEDVNTTVPGSWVTVYQTT
jgi:hypothetical protein